MDVWVTVVACMFVINIIRLGSISGYESMHLFPNLIFFVVLDLEGLTSVDAEVQIGLLEKHKQSNLFFKFKSACLFFFNFFC